MTGAEIRRAFLSYFEERDHRVVASSSLVPDRDPTLMFANAGMVQFKRVFIGEEARDYTRAVTAQRCMRVSGKHNDLEEVGRSPSHQTLFEMLGNFSFGDYFKREAIEYGWEFLTEVLRLDGDKLVVSVLRSDEEAFELWRDRAGLPESRIYRLDEKENFWQMGDSGPCGPCSEIHLVTAEPCGKPNCDPSCDCGRFVELWNLVFMQFEQAPDGSRTPLPKPSIDTGMGLERVTRVMQGCDSNYDTDLLRPLISRAEEISGRRYGDSAESDVSLQVVADHARACSFLVGDGILPSNEGRGYVLRRVLRRAARHGVLLGLEEPFLYLVANSVVEAMGEAYPELVERGPFIEDTLRREEERFLKTLGRGLSLLDDEIAIARKQRRKTLSGKVVFKLYDTFGFPADLTQDILQGKQLAYDQDEFDVSMREQSERARAAWKGSGEQATPEVYGTVAARGKTRFVGYDQLEARSTVVALLRTGEVVERADEGEHIELVVETTPFYAESGGQVGDTGVIEGASGTVEVEDTQKPVDGLVVHVGRVSLGSIRAGEQVELRVNLENRLATVRNHSGTHLFHYALRRLLGPQVTQAGSLVAPDRLRFDFTCDDALTDDQIRELEDEVNGLIFQNLPGQVQERSYQEALESGAVAIFAEKYGDVVRVVSFGPSTELCGGTHVRATGDIGCFRVVSQSAVGAGLRRVEATTGFGVIEQARREERSLRKSAELLRVSPAEVPERIERLLERQRELEKEVEKARAELRRGGQSDPMQQLCEVAGVKLVAAEVSDATPKELRALVDELKQRLGSGLVLLAARDGEKVALAMGVTKDLTGRFKAGALVKQIAEVVGGTGGGRPDFAQAGGTRVGEISAALARLRQLVEAG